MTRKPAFFWIVIVVGAVVLAYYPFVLHVLVAHAGPGSTRGWFATEDGKNTPVVLTVYPTGPAAGKLARGDRILAVNGDARVVPELWGHFVEMWPGTSYTLRIERGGVISDVALVLGERRELSFRWIKAQFVVLSLGFLAAGLLIGLLRPEEKTARVFAAASFLGVALFLGWPLQTPSIPAFRLPPVEAFLIALLWAPATILPAAIYHAYLRFPPGVPTGRGWMALKLPLYAFGGLSALWPFFDRMLDVSGSASRIAFVTAHPSVLRAGDFLTQFILPFTLCAFLAALALLVRNYRVVRDVDQRRRIQWFVWGQAIAATPLVLAMAYLVVAETIGGGIVISEDGLRMFAIANTVLLFSPAVFVYSLLKHDMLDIRIALRRGMQYLLATSLLRILVFGPLVLLGIGVLTNPNRTVGEILFGQPLFLALALLGGLGLRFRQRVSAWIDRRFFREAYDSQHLLLGLVDEVKKLDSLGEVARLVTERVEAALHPEGVQLLWRDAVSGFGVGHASGADTVANTVSDGSTLMRALESSGEARETTAQEIAEAGLTGSGGIAPCLAVPIGGGERRLGGFLLLGPNHRTQRKTAVFLARSQRRSAWSTRTPRSRDRRPKTRAPNTTCSLTSNRQASTS